MNAARGKIEALQLAIQTLIAMHPQKDAIHGFLLRLRVQMPGMIESDMPGDFLEAFQSTLTVLCDGPAEL